MTSKTRLSNGKIAILLMIFLLAGLYSHVAKSLIWNLTDSVKPTVMVRADGLATTGDYVTFFLTHPYLKEGTKAYRLTKFFQCGPNDILETRGDTLYCNNEVVAKTLEYTQTGKPLKPFQWSGPIPEGKAFLLGDDPESFDSRYWGFMDIDRLERLDALF